MYRRSVIEVVDGRTLLKVEKVGDKLHFDFSDINEPESSYAGLSAPALEFYALLHEMMGED